MVHVPPKPATPDANAVLAAFRHSLPSGAAYEQRGEIHSGVDGQLERTPKPAVHLHEYVAACRLLALALDHGHTLPAECVEQAESGSDQPRFERDALPIDADAAGGRLLSQAAMSKQGNRPTAPAECKKPLAGAGDPLLQQDRERRGGERSQRVTARGRVRHRRHRHLAPASPDRDHRAVWLDDGRKESGVGRRRVQLPWRGDDARLGHAEAAASSQSQHVRLVRGCSVRCEIGKRQGDPRRQHLAMLE